VPECIPQGAPPPLEAEGGIAHGSGDPTGGTARDADDLDVTQKQRHLEWRISLTSNRFLRSFFHLLWKRKPVITPLARVSEWIPASDMEHVLVRAVLDTPLAFGETILAKISPCAS
jgi:hypothetical protein